MKKIIIFIILLLSLCPLTAESKRTESSESSESSGNIVSDGLSYLEADIILGFIIFCNDKGIQVKKGTAEYETLLYAYAYGYARGYKTLESTLMDE